MFVCCVLLGIGFCDELITRPEEYYQLWRVVVYVNENLVGEEAIARAVLQCQREKKGANKNKMVCKVIHYENGFYCSVHYSEV
jgi:hypothetical protein